VAKDKLKLPKPRNAYAVSAFLRSGGGVHKTARPQHEPTVEEGLEEMADENEEYAAIIADYERDSQQGDE
jgi:hypothetical protein